MKKAHRCARCRKRIRKDEDWNVQFSKGFAVAVICHTCLTPEEHLQAEVNAATVDYSSLAVDELGRVSAIPRVKP